MVERLWTTSPHAGTRSSAMLYTLAARRLLGSRRWLLVFLIILDVEPLLVRSAKAAPDAVDSRQRLADRSHVRAHVRVPDGQSIHHGSECVNHQPRVMGPVNGLAASCPSPFPVHGKGTPT